MSLYVMHIYNLMESKFISLNVHQSFTFIKRTLSHYYLCLISRMQFTNQNEYKMYQ